jgi:hypothetical protein
MFLVLLPRKNRHRLWAAPAVASREADVFGGQDCGNLAGNPKWKPDWKPCGNPNAISSTVEISLTLCKLGECFFWMETLEP